MGKEFEPQPASNLLPENSIEEPVNKPEEKPVLLGVGSNPKELPPRATIVHIAQYPSASLIEKVIDSCPNLKVIQFPPSSYKRSVRPGATLPKLLEARGINVTMGTFFPHRKEDLDKRESPVWEARRIFLLDLKPKERRILYRAREMGFEEAEMVFRYFCLDEPRPPRLSFLALGSKYGGISYTAARNKVLAVLRVLGFPCEEKTIRLGAATFIRKYNKVIRNERKARELATKKRLYEEFQPIPPGLPQGQWEYFWGLTRIKAQTPEKFASLPERFQQILNLYYGLEDGIYRTERKVMMVLGLNVTKQMIGSIKLRGLQHLGIREKRKRSIKIESLKHCLHGLVEDWCGECNPPKGFGEEE
jgi:hypothetical protein